ncbi:MAG TPA: S9 family peptidase [Sphingobacteriaceae bacterium]
MRIVELFTKYLCLLIAVLFFSCKSEKKARTIPVEDFFKNPEKTAFLISPDGRFISYLQPFENRLNLFVTTLDGKSVQRITSETDRNISYYFWADNDQLIYVKDRNGEKNGQLFAVKKDGTRHRNLVPYPDVKFSLINTDPLKNGQLLVALNKRDVAAFDAYRLDINTGKLTLITQNPGNIARWYADPQGKIRLAVAGDGVNETILYRQDEGQKFRSVVTNNFKSTIAPIGFCKDHACIYAISNNNRDKSVLVEFDCNTGKEHKVIYANPKVDVTEAYYSSRQQKPLYVGFESWKKERRFLDPASEAIYRSLQKQLPKAEIKMTSADSSAQKFIIRTFTDRNPGAYYLYTLADKKLKLLSVTNPALKEDEMCEMKPISYKTRDNLTIHGYLTLPKGVKPSNLPVIVLPHGGPSSRNTWGFNSEVQFLANRGYAVFQMNYRGSTGYGKSFWTAGFKQWGGKMQNDITDGVRWLISEGIADPKRIGIYGSSFGGYSALHGLCFNSELYACGASYSGLVNLFTYLKGIPPHYKPYLEMYYEMVGNPETNADYFRNVSPVFHTNQIKVPVLIAQGTKDPRVNISETNQFVRELKSRGVPVTYIVKENEGHFFKNQENRLEFYQQLEKFLATNLQQK